MKKGEGRDSRLEDLTPAPILRLSSRGSRGRDPRLFLFPALTFDYTRRGQGKKTLIVFLMFLMCLIQMSGLRSGYPFKGEPWFGIGLSGIWFLCAWIFMAVDINYTLRSSTYSIDLLR